MFCAVCPQHRVALNVQCGGSSAHSSSECSNAAGPRHRVAQNVQCGGSQLSIVFF
jgi:hypothetical protein